MKFAKLIAIIAYAIIGTTTAVSAQEKTNSVGPVIEFGGGGTSFGIQGKARVSDQISVRPVILFGYKPSVSQSDINQAFLNVAANQQINLTTAQADLNTTAGKQTITDINNNLGSGIGYGLAVTYDFKSPDSKIVGYVGPRILFASTSGSGKLTSGSTAPGASFTTSTNETNIGLTAGADYAIAPDITAGINATYNFSRSGTVSFTDSGGTTARTGLSGGNFSVGINAAYNF
jgi:opacity protein-like surface antigen